MILISPFPHAADIKRGKVYPDDDDDDDDDDVS